MCRRSRGKGPRENDRGAHRWARWQKKRRGGEKNGAALCELHDDAVVGGSIPFPTIVRHRIMSVIMRASTGFIGGMNPGVCGRPGREDVQRQHQGDAEHRDEAVQAGVGWD
jgi:hypothetical protein